MEVPSSNDVVSNCNDEDNALRCLLEAFGSFFSLEAIASAYCQAGRNADLAGQILHDMQGTGPAACTSDGQVRHEELLMKSIGNFKAAKQKGRSVSGGTVSSLLGKDYVRSSSLANGPCEATKPLKLDAKELPLCELWGKEGELKPSRNDPLHKDMEDFLFKMLGDGFQMERDVVLQVLDKCGYDMQKSMDKLLDLSAVNLDRRSKQSSKSTEKGTGAYPNFRGPSCQKELQPMNSNGGSTTSTTHGQEKGRNDLQKELLAALFDSTEKSDKLSRRRTRDTRRSLIYGQLVTEPPRDFILEHKADSVDLQQDNKKNEDEDEDEDEDDSYQLLRKAVKEYRHTMREYYKAAGHAFAKGDNDRAAKLMDQGHFFRDKARAADEESSQKIFETKNVENQDKILLDLHDYGAKEAIRQLKCHISSLSGIPSYKYLNVIIETDEEDSTKGARRRLVMKLLERESIKWTEGGNDGTILIHLDTINPKRLSFAKK